MSSVNPIEPITIFCLLKWIFSFLRRKLALYDYDPNQLSPNVDSEVELSFRAGDIVLVFGDMDDDGFFMGELHGRRGLLVDHGDHSRKLGPFQKMCNHL